MAGTARVQLNVRIVGTTQRRSAHCVGQEIVVTGEKCSSPRVEGANPFDICVGGNIDVGQCPVFLHWIGSGTIKFDGNIATHPHPTFFGDRDGRIGGGGSARPIAGDRYRDGGASSTIATARGGDDDADNAAA